MNLPTLPCAATPARARRPLCPTLLNLAMATALPAAAADYSGPITVDGGQARHFEDDRIVQDRAGTALSVRGTGSEVSVVDSTIALGAAVTTAQAVQASAGGRASLGRSILELSPGSTAAALLATGTGSRIDGSDLQLQGGGRLEAHDSAVLTLVDSRFDASGSNPRIGGLRATTDAQVLLRNVDYLNGFLDVASGAQVEAENVTLTGTIGSARLLGNAATGDYAALHIVGGLYDSSGDIGFNINSGGRLLAEGTRIRSAPGTGSAAIWLSSDSSDLQLRGSQLDVFGEGRYAVELFGGNALLIDDVINVHGDRGQGLRATGSTGSTLTRLQASGSRIELQGNDATGVFVGGGATRASLQDVRIDSDGLRASGVVQMNTAALDLAKGLHIDLRGAQSIGWRSYLTADGDYWNRALLQDGTLRTPAGTAFWLQGGNHELQLQGMQVNEAAPAGALLRVGDTVFNDGSRIAAGTVQVAALDSILSGDITVESPTAAVDISLAGASLWRGALREVNGLHARSMHVAAGSHWTVTGDSAVETLDHAGTIAFIAPAAQPFAQLTVHGDYAGHGGLLVLNTRLEGDDAPSNLLHIEGDSSGSTRLQVENAGGGGAATVEGLRVVQVDGTSGAAFALEGRAVAGAYEYFLHQGSAAVPGDGDWYLRSQLPSDPVNPCEQDPAAPGCTPVTPPITPPVTVPPVTPITPPVITPPVTLITPPVIPPTVSPLVQRPEVGAWLANQAAALHLFDMTLHQRSGDPSLPAAQDGITAWLRMPSANARMDVTDQLQGRRQQHVVQAGADLLRWGHGSHGVAGVMTGSGRADQQVMSTRTGYSADGRIDGRSVGVYASWLQEARYLDSWLQHADFRGSVQGEALARERYRARSTSASVEVGQSLAVFQSGAHALYLEPQVQVTWNSWSMAGGTHIEQNGTRVSVADAGGLQTRVGLRLHGRPLADASAGVQPFLTVDWITRHGAGNAMRFDDARVSGGDPRTVYQVRAGVQAQLSERVAAWGELDVARGASNFRQYGALIGIRYGF